MPSCQVANRSFQNNKKTKRKGSRSIDNKIDLVACVRLLSVLLQFWDNFYLDKLAEQLEAYKMSCNKKKKPQKGASPFCVSAIAEEEKHDKFHDDINYDKSVYNEGAVVSPLQENRSSTRHQNPAGGAAVCHPSLLAQPNFGKPSQLVESADGDVNVLGLVFNIGNILRTTDTARGFSNWATIMMYLHYPGDFGKTELKVVPGNLSFLEISYPAVSAALKNDFHWIAANMEVEVKEANKGNPNFVENVQDRINVQETHLAKSDGKINKKYLLLPIDPTTGSHYMQQL